ncbi:hypothetical protein KA013_02985 [Patescibacteria group bacterium]|nr:hypothetical protein [Patescibacteria group bacterium]
MAFQADNGGFDYWVGTPKSADYGLSLSIYGGLLQAWKYGYIEPNSALDGMLKKVEIYLATTPPDWEQEQIDTTYLMMARQQASA